MKLFIPVGRLATEPSTRTTATGKTICSFTFAVDTGFKDGNDQFITNFLQVSAWGKVGEKAQNNLHKGDAVSITGSFCARPYESKKDNTTRTSLDLNADEITYLPGGKKNSDNKDANNEKPQAKRRRPAQQETQADDDDELPF